MHMYIYIYDVKLWSILSWNPSVVLYFTVRWDVVHTSTGAAWNCYFMWFCASRKSIMSSSTKICTIYTFCKSFFSHIYIYIYLGGWLWNSPLWRALKSLLNSWIVEWFLQYPTLATRWQQHEYVCPSHLVPEVHWWHHLLMDWDLVWSETLPGCHHDAAEMT